MRRFYVVSTVPSLLLLSSLSVFAQTQSRDDLLRQIDSKRSELAALEKTFLSPSEEDQAQYAEFLRLSGTGLIRLLPREKYDSEGNKDVKQALSIRGAGAFYSFTRFTHEYGYGSDILLSGGELSTGFAGADYGMLANIGNVPLETVTLETPSANALASYVPPTEEPQARAEYRRVGQGTEIEGVKVSNRLPLKSNSTYLLRAISYSRSDVLVALRVVRIDNDGSAIILWKMLKNYPTPPLARNNN